MTDLTLALKRNNKFLIFIRKKKIVKFVCKCTQVFIDRDGGQSRDLDLDILFALKVSNLCL